MIESREKNILAVVSYPFLPATTGGEISTLNILNYMAQRHRVTVFTVEPYSGRYDAGSLRFELIAGMPFKVSRYINLSLIGKLRKLIRSRNTEILFFDQPWFGWLMLALRIVTGKKIFMRSNNIEYLRFKSMGKWFWQMLYIYEKWTYRVAHLVIFVSETDRQKAIYEFDLDPDRTLLTPYGVELTEAPSRKAGARAFLEKEYNIGNNERILLFFATMSYGPNYEAVEHIANSIYPLLKSKGQPFRVLICGKNLPEHVKALLTDKPELTYCGFVDDIDMYIDGADVMINPILSGGGVKTKAIDTLARSRKVVSTQTGAEGIDPAVCGQMLVILPDLDWAAFTDAAMEKNANDTIPPAFYSTYSWKFIIDKLTERLALLP